MRLDHAARLERLLDRHPEIRHVPGAGGNGTLIRNDQLLVVRSEADAVYQRTSRWVDRVEHDDDAGVTVLHLRASAKVDPCELGASLSDGSAHRRANVSPNHIMTAAPNYEPGPFDDPAPIDTVPSAPADHPTKRVVTVAILDTGIAEHPWFNGRSWFDACGGDVREVADLDHDARLDSVAGHGTFITGVVLQQAPEANLLIDRTIDADGVTDEHRLVKALARTRTRARQANTVLDVVSLSLGCFTYDDKPSPVLEHAINSLDRATLVVACAGNANTDRPFWPAALKRVIAVASLDAAGTDRAPFSNYGWWVDACTSGENVVSSFFSFEGLGPDGAEKFNGYASWSGTSFAAPRLAGAIAARAGERDLAATTAAAELLDVATSPSMPDLGVMVDVDVALRPVRS